MDYYIVKVKVKNIGLLQPIVAVGDKAELTDLIKKHHGDGAVIEFSPKKYSFNDLFIGSLNPGLHSFADLIWDKK